jgi:hypothetical protein
MTGRSLGCALSNLLLTGAHHTVVSLGAKTQFSSSDERNSTPRSSTFVVEPLIE